jgi:hypothetical protein
MLTHTLQSMETPNHGKDAPHFKTSGAWLHAQKSYITLELY